MWQERLSEFVTLFLVINPVGVLPVFIATTGGLKPAIQRKIALRAVIVAFAVLAFFVAAGDFLLSQMGISVRAFQISGGIVLFLVALDMVRGDGHSPAPGQSKAALALAIYPIGIPKIAGPGAMLAVVWLADDDRNIPFQQLATIGVLGVVLAIQLAILLASGPISRVIGPAAAAVIGRVMGIILAAFAVSLVLTAVGEWLSLPKL